MAKTEIPTKTYLIPFRPEYLLCGDCKSLVPMDQTMPEEFAYYRFYFNLSKQGLQLAEEVGVNPNRGFTEMTIRFNAMENGLVMIELEQVTDAVAKLHGLP